MQLSAKGAKAVKGGFQVSPSVTFCKLSDPRAGCVCAMDLAQLKADSPRTAAHVRDARDFDEDALAFPRGTRFEQLQCPPQ